MVGSILNVPVLQCLTTQTKLAFFIVGYIKIIIYSLFFKYIFTALDMDRSFCSVQPQFSLQAPAITSPVRQRASIAGQSVDSAHFRKFLHDRRKSYRNRSLGPTIASAPSVEQEDYRTPKPSFDKNGKSFDCCGGHMGSLASDSNGLVKV
uniref:Uncharacterized protein n=1 Tax=Heterorhabditis bacteriophora TaxID=37862 RepID=A0A1I7WIN4_HETBA